MRFSAALHMEMARRLRERADKSAAPRRQKMMRMAEMFRMLAKSAAKRLSGSRC
jgi:hypothetical protein